MVTEKKHFRLLFLLLSFFLLSCASSGKTVRYNDSFFEDAKKDFYETKLSNNIPVYLKQISREKTITLSLLFLGGPEVNDKTGLQQMTLSYMSSSSKNHPVEELRNISARGECFLESECFNDFSTYTLTSSKEKFSSNLEIFKDTFFNPDFGEENFRSVMLSKVSEVMDKNENPEWLLLKNIYSVCYKDTPYASGVEFYPESEITPSDLMGQYLKLLNSDRMMIFASGDFSALAKNVKKKDSYKEGIEVFFQKMSEAFSGLKGSGFVRPAVKELRFSGKKNAVIGSEFSRGKVNAAFLWKCPCRGDDDYEAFACVSMIFDSLIQKEFLKTGIASRSGFGVINGRESIGMILVLDSENVDSVNAAMGKILEEFPSEKDIDENLFLMKNLYIKKIISSLSVDRLSVNQMISSRLYEGNSFTYLERPEKIYQLTSSDIYECFEKYFKNAPSVSVIVD